jgi:hypothetical protein
MTDPTITTIGVDTLAAYNVNQQSGQQNKDTNIQANHVTP